MKTTRPRDIGKVLRNDTLLAKALRKGVQEAYRRHRLAGLPVVVWRDGRVAWVDPAEAERGVGQKGNGR